MKIPNSPGVWRVNRPSAKFTTVSNEFVRSRIKPGAKALALYLLSQSDGYVITQKRITAEIGMSGAALTTAFTALEEEGYLVRRVVYGPRGGVLGTCYLVSDHPLDEALISDFMVKESMTLESKTMLSEGHKKTNSNQKTKEQEKTSSAPGDAEPGLFDLPESFPEHDAKDVHTVGTLGGNTVANHDAIAQTRTNAGEVVKAFVDSYRLAHGGKDPLGPDVGKVGGNARRLLEGGAEPEVLVAAADAMGRTDFTDLGTAYRRQSRTVSTNQDPTRGYFRAEQKNEFVPPVGETVEQANARVRAHMEWLKKFNAGQATMADKPQS